MWKDVSIQYSFKSIQYITILSRLYFCLILLLLLPPFLFLVPSNCSLFLSCPVFILVNAESNHSPSNYAGDVNLKQPAGLQIASSVVLWGLGAPLPHRLSSLQCFWAKLRKMSSAATYARNPAPDMTAITKAMRWYWSIFDYQPLWMFRSNWKNDG